MSMSTGVVGFRPPNEKWRAMKAVWDSCRKAGIEPPKEVLAFFDGKRPDPAGVEVELECVSEYHGDGREGLEVDILSLPQDVTVVRFFNSW